MLTEVVLIPPLESDCKIVVLQNDVIKLLQQFRGLVWM